MYPEEAAKLHTVSLTEAGLESKEKMHIMKIFKRRQAVSEGIGELLQGDEILRGGGGFFRRKTRKNIFENPGVGSNICFQVIYFILSQFTKRCY